METSPKETTAKQKLFFRGDPVTSVVLLLTLFIASQLAAAVLISLVPAIIDRTAAERSNPLNSIGGRFAYMAIAETLAIYGVIRLAKAAKVHIRQIGLVASRFRDFGWALLAYGLYFLVYTAIVILVAQLVPAVNLEQEQQIGFEDAYSVSELIMTFLMLVVLVPIAEEIMFRGFLFSSLRAKYRFWPSAIITGLIFGVAHLQLGSGAPLLWVAAIDTFILSCFLCYLREHFKSIWPSIYLHAIKNSVAFIVLFAPRLFFYL